MGHPHSGGSMKLLRNLFIYALGCVAGLTAGGHACAREMTISGAASLTDAFNELIELFKKDHPDLVINANYAASNPLLRQMAAGAPVDVFASADEATMDEAVKEKVVKPATRKNFAANTLTLIVPKGSPAPATLEELSRFRKIAIGNPDSVPAGRYAKEALSKAGLWDKLQANMIFGTNVRQVLDYVARGEADAGFVYGTDAKQKADKVDAALVVEGHAPVNYPIAVAVTGNNPEDGQAFVDFVLSPAAQEVLAKYGFKKAN